MNFKRLYEILGECTVQLRKGEIVTEEKHGPIDVVTINMMPQVSEARGDLMKIDMEMLVIGVDQAKAEQHRAEFIDILNSYPEPDRLAGGPSYIEVGAVIGSQGGAFQMFALGEALGLWKVMTPGALGFTGAEAKQMAGSGFIMITGYKPS